MVNFGRAALSTGPFLFGGYRGPPYYVFSFFTFHLVIELT